MLILPPTFIKGSEIAQSINICKTKGLSFTTLEPLMCHCLDYPRVKL